MTSRQTQLEETALQRHLPKLQSRGREEGDCKSALGRFCIHECSSEGTKPEIMQYLKPLLLAAALMWCIIFIYKYHNL